MKACSALVSDCGRTVAGLNRTTISSMEAELVFEKKLKLAECRGGLAFPSVVNSSQQTLQTFWSAV